MRTFTKDGEIKNIHPRATETIETLLSKGWVEIDGKLI